MDIGSEIEKTTGTESIDCLNNPDSAALQFKRLRMQLSLCPAKIRF